MQICGLCYGTLFPPPERGIVITQDLSHYTVSEISLVLYRLSSCMIRVPYPPLQICLYSRANSPQNCSQSPFRPSRRLFQPQLLQWCDFAPNPGGPLAVLLHLSTYLTHPTQLIRCPSHISTTAHNNQERIWSICSFIFFA